MSNLKQLLSGIIPLATDNQVLESVGISGVFQHACDVVEGSLFCDAANWPMFGPNEDSQSEAVEMGAAAIVEESYAYGDESIKYRKAPAGDRLVPVIPILELQYQIGEIAARFHARPSRNLNLIGVTGTNGKTSTVGMISQLLNGLGDRCEAVGTLAPHGIPGVLGFNLNKPNTTPDAADLQQILASFAARQTQAVAVEASSHGLVMGRCVAAEFDTAIFTNFTEEHLEDHGSMEAYWNAKRKLFFEYDSLRNAIINIDDPKGWELMEDLRQMNEVESDDKKMQIFAVSRNDKSIPGVTVVVAKTIGQARDGITVDLQTLWGSGHAKLPILGPGNALNLACAVIVAGSRGHKFGEIQKSISSLKPVSGRMQTIGTDLQKPLVIVDSATCAASLEHGLTSLTSLIQAENRGGTLHCVVGCGGQRFPGKRAPTAEVACRLAQRVIFTDDNPRFEDPDEIWRHMRAGVPAEFENIIWEHDRKKAIEDAIEKATAEDAVLIAGRGGEVYQKVGNERRRLVDEEVAAEALARWN